MKKWIMAARPWSFPASLMPALVAIAYVFFMDSAFANVNWLLGLLAALGAVVFHCAGNLLSDYFDFKHGVDTAENLTSSNRTMVDGVLSPQSVLRFSLVMFAIGIAIGLVLTFRCGLPILYMGLIGFFLSVFYYKFKFSALGDLNILITFGMLIALGVVYTLTQQFFPKILCVSLPTGLLVVSILHANNTRDRDLDASAGIKTFAMFLGLRGSRIYYALLQFGAYVLVVLDVMLQILPLWSLLVFLSLPMAIKNVKSIYGSDDMSTIAALDGASAQLVMLFSLLLAISCLCAGLL